VRSEKAIRIAYPDSIFAGLGIQHVTRMRHIVNCGLDKRAVLEIAVNFTSLFDMYMSYADSDGTPIVAYREEKCDVIASATDVFLLYHVTLEKASRNGNLGTRYVYVCEDAECGRGRVGGGRLHTIHPLRRWLISSARTAVSYGCYSSVSILLSTNPCDMYKSSLRHIHDPVLLSQDRNNTFF